MLLFLVRTDRQTVEACYLLNCITREQQSTSFIFPNQTKLNFFAPTADVMWVRAVLCASAGLVAGLHTKQQPFHSVSVQSAITGRRQDTLALKHHCVTLKITAAGKA